MDGRNNSLWPSSYSLCACACECWICRIVCLESSHSSGQVLQNPLGISGAWRRDLDPLACGSLKGVFAGHCAGPAGDCVFSWCHSPAGSALLPFGLEEAEHWGTHLVCGVELVRELSLIMLWFWNRWFIFFPGLLFLKLCDAGSLHYFSSTWK